MKYCKETAQIYRRRKIEIFKLVAMGEPLRAVGKKYGISSMGVTHHALGVWRDIVRWNSNLSIYTNGYYSLGNITDLRRQGAFWVSRLKKTRIGGQP